MLFEIMLNPVVSMVLGVSLGLAVAESFNGFFGVFGFIFQLFRSAPIERELVCPGRARRERQSRQPSMSPAGDDEEGTGSGPGHGASVGRKDDGTSERTPCKITSQRGGRQCGRSEGPLPPWRGRGSGCGRSERSGKSTLLKACALTAICRGGGARRPQGNQALGPELVSLRHRSCPSSSRTEPAPTSTR